MFLVILIAVLKSPLFGDYNKLPNTTEAVHDHFESVHGRNLLRGTKKSAKAAHMARI